MFAFFVPGITRLPVLEGEVSHVEIPRTSQNLGITIVGGADTPLVSTGKLYRESIRGEASFLIPSSHVTHSVVDRSMKLVARLDGSLKAWLWSPGSGPT